MKKSVLAIALAVLMAVSILTVGAMAATVEGIRYKDANGKMQTCESATVLTANSKTWGEGWYLARNTLEIDGRVTVSGDVHLILKDGCKLDIMNGGIYVPYGSSLTIYGQGKGTGELNVKGAYETAGIGGKEYSDGSKTGENGDITINGGVINAEGGTHGAGIGSGYFVNHNTSEGCGKITINGGTVTAKGGSRAAGIGGGFASFCPSIEISGGKVNATGGTEGAGIGSGSDDHCQKFADGAVIAIKGNADVTAIAGGSAAGIGTGYACRFGVKQIVINGNAVVNATGGAKAEDTYGGGAGIGAGYSSYTTDKSYRISTIVINGNANVTAAGGTGSTGSGAGIGAGSNCECLSGTIRILNGTVKAVSGENGAGIGAYSDGNAYFSKNLAIVINGGVVEAIGGKGINCGNEGSFTTDYNNKTGSAFITTSSISDSDDTSGWSCIVKSGNDITVYGDIELDNDLEIGENEKLIITEGSTLTIPDGVTVTNSGSIVINGVVNGSVSDGQGKTCTYITLADSVVYNGTITYDVGNAVITVGSKNIGTYSPVVGNEPGENEYIATAKEGYVLNPLGTLTINKAPLTITAKDMAVIAGDPVPTYSYEVSGLLEEDKLDKEPVLSCEVDMNVPGSYDIIASGAEAANYEITYVNGTLTVQPAWYVTLVFNNGSPDEVINILKGGTITLPTPTNSGYIFLGWRDNNNVTHKAGEVVTVTADTTFVAVWGNLPDVKPSEPETPDTPVFPFYDVTARDWYYSAVKYVYEKGLMDGVDVGVFAPNDTLTRAMVWTIIARAEGVDTTGGATWYAKAQEWVTAKGISDGENPNAAITRQELVTMLYRLAGEPSVSGTITAPDAASVSTWATNAMTWAMNIGLVEGDENGAVTPTATATRAQAAALIMRYLEA